VVVGEVSANIQVDNQVVSSTRIAGPTPIVGHAEIVITNGEVVEGEGDLASPCAVGPNTSGKPNVLSIGLNDHLVILSSPLEVKVINRPLPECSIGEGLIISKSDLADISVDIADEWISKDVVGISSDGNNTKDAKQGTHDDGINEEQLAEDDLASATNFLIFHYTD